MQLIITLIINIIATVLIQLDRITMLTLLACMATLIGVFIYYMTNKNQRVLSSPLSKQYRPISYIALVLALIAWQQVLTPASAIFMWLMTLMLFFILTPLFTLLSTKNISHD